MKIVVIGAYGYTGELVCRTLIAQGMPFAIAGRNKSALNALNSNFETPLNVELIDLLDEEEVIKLVGNYDIFINCVGPFSETANYLLKHISQSKKLYCDITGEIAFVQSSKNDYDQIAKTNGATILHSCAFESVLTNLLGRLLLNDKKGIEAINSYYFLGKGRPSPGTRLTMKLSKFKDPFFIIEGKQKSSFLIELEDYKSDRIFNHSAMPYPLPEVCFFNWETDIPNIGSFLLVDTDEAKYMKLNNEPSTDVEMKQEVIDLHNARKPKGPNEKRRSDQAFTVFLEVKTKSSLVKMYVKGKDMYLLTAEILVYFVKTYMNNKDNKTGVLTPSQFLGEEHTLFSDLNLEIGNV